MFPFGVPICKLCGGEINLNQPFACYTNGMEMIYVHSMPVHCDQEGMKDISELRRLWELEDTRYEFF